MRDHGAQDYVGLRPRTPRRLARSVGNEGHCHLSERGGTWVEFGITVG
jgi:hypothetical protein